ncbi:MAG TPA: hypothetical protein VJQ52_15305 [Steroidobacteraceae bacterium]|nr:hypothetical protein [Steroidobacteraceae bacterium]
MLVETHVTQTSKHTLRRFVPAMALLACFGVAAQSAAPELSFRIDEGRNVNSFVREDGVAAHLLLRSGTDPRILAAFPAGNSGVGLWFAKTTKPVVWTLTDPPRPLTLQDRKGRPLHGIEAEAVVDAAELNVRQAVLSSVRVLRDYEILSTAPEQVLTAPTIDGKRIIWERERLDGAPGYRLSIEALDGVLLSPTSIGSAGGRIRLKIQALTGETPLTPLATPSLLTTAAAADQRSREVLTFLSYREKFLAGSWRFDTYFGRDTLISLSLLAPVLQPPAIESGIGSVLARLAPNGEVAHEEDIGEFAVLRNIKEGRGARDTPIYDYGMVDDDFMLAPVAARWLADDERGRDRAAAFLAAKSGSVRNGDALVRNLVWVVERTAAFASDARAANLVGIKEGRMTGDWRDSEEGLGRGRYAYDVNAVFVPAALRAIDRLLKSGSLNPYLSDSQHRTLARAGNQAAVWSAKAPPLFVVTVPAERARQQVDAYARDLKLTGMALPKIDRAITFDALSLDAKGRPIPIMHSDGGFALLFGEPTPAELQRIAEVMQPFPAGLLTPVGMLVANPVFADREAQSRFTSSAYHGTVFWSWQHAVAAAGLDRQIVRAELAEPLRSRLAAARSQLWSAIDTSRSLRTSELWTWAFVDGNFRAEPFGQQGAHADESNAAQLWSTVFLALHAPSGGASLPLHAGQQKLGMISFENSGAAAAQADFITGLAALHNFQYPIAARAFQRAQAADPDFALAYWGEAMSHDHAVWHEQDSAAGRAALAKLGPTPEARAAKAKTPREKAYLGAVELLFGSSDENDREQRYAAAMEKLHEAYPDDVDATCFYALALLGTSNAGRDVPTYMRAAALMEDVFERNPQHPGAAHYLIHSVDDSVHAPLGLRAAYAYARIAPDSPHAQHMTSHIFLALGMWDETVAANERSVSLINESLRARDKNAPPVGCGHAVTWLAYAYLQQGRFADARRLTEGCGEEMRTRPSMPAHEMGAHRALDYDNSSAASFSMMRSRYLIDSGDWSGPVAAMQVNVDQLITAEFTRDWTDAYGAVRYGKLEDAVAAMKRVEDSGKRYVAAVNAAGVAVDGPEHRVAKIEAQQLQGLLLLKRGRTNEGVALLSEAAAGERAIPMEFGPPSLDKPANELLGEVLLDLGRAREACAAFEAAQVVAPGRGQSLIGLAKCARQLGKPGIADSAEARLGKVRLREALAAGH